jgi:hypothetical protein
MVAWFWVLKIRLRLAGKEPEANINFTDEDLYNSMRHPTLMKGYIDKVELLHLSSEGRVFYRVYNDTATPYEVVLDYTGFQAGATPAQVVRSCNCKDFVKRGGVCKHAGACCHHLLRHTAEVERSCVTGPPLASGDAVQPSKSPYSRFVDKALLALEAPAAVRRAVSLDVPRNARGADRSEPTLCLAALRQKAKEIQSRLFIRSRTMAAVPDPATTTVETAVLARGVAAATQTVGKTGATFLAAVEAQRYTECLLHDAAIIESVEFVAYSFDVQAITDALVHLGPKVRILMDSSMCFGRTRRQLQAAQQLASNGCCVRVGRGHSVREAYRARDREVKIDDSVKGIIHGKSVLIRYNPALSQDGAVCVIGSTNWTDSSTANLEFSAVLHAVGEAFVEAWSNEFARGWASSLSLDAAIAEEDRKGYGRRSASSASRSASVSRGR